MNTMVEGHASAATNDNKKKALVTEAAGTAQTVRFSSPSQTSRTFGNMRAKTVDNVTASKPVTMTSVSYSLHCSSVLRSNYITDFIAGILEGNPQKELQWRL